MPQRLQRLGAILTTVLLGCVGCAERLPEPAHRAPPGYEGGRRFENREHQLPHKNKDGQPIVYQEWDVNPKMPGVNRGPERLVTGSDGNVRFTADHYKTFIKLR